MFQPYASALVPSLGTPIEDFAAMRQRIIDAGGELVEPLRETPFERVFFREPVNGYLLEVIDNARHRQLLAEQARNGQD